MKLNTSISTVGGGLIVGVMSPVEMPFKPVAGGTEHFRVLAAADDAAEVG
jgi:hypothetical protein